MEHLWRSFSEAQTSITLLQVVLFSFAGPLSTYTVHNARHSEFLKFSQLSFLEYAFIFLSYPFKFTLALKYNLGPFCLFSFEISAQTRSLFWCHLSTSLSFQAKI